MEISSRDLLLMATFASLCAALVYTLAPILFYALQFRVADVLPPAIAKKWILSIGYAIGVVVGNFFGPFVGMYELLFIPTMSLLAAVLGARANNMLHLSTHIEGHKTRYTWWQR